MKTLRILPALAVALVIMCTNLAAQYCQQLPCRCGDQGNWQTLQFGPGSIFTPLLLTDGRVMVQFLGTPGQGLNWYALSPDLSGGYTNPNNWTELPSLSSVWSGSYAPYAFASAVLADGRVIVQGGEENYAGSGNTNKGAIFDPNPAVNSWSMLLPPGYLNDSWPNIADAQSVVLPDKTYMVAACGSTRNCSQIYQQAILDPVSMNWTILASDEKYDSNSEEGYTLLPGQNGMVLTIDTNADAPIYELFDPNPQVRMWTHYSLCANINNTCVPIYLYGSFPNTSEIGPAIGLQDGTVLATGASVPSNTVTGNPRVAATGIYNPVGNSWTVGPTFPVLSQGQLNLYLGMGDESAVLLPGGNVLLAVHNSSNEVGYEEYYLEEYQPQTQSLCSITNAPSTLAQNVQPATIRMLLLPNGQVFVTSYDGENPQNYYYIYTPAPQIVSSSVRPFISSVSSTLVQGSLSNPISGTLFNGVSQANMFGDDFQNATNYPLVRITNNSTHHVFYARTHDHNTMEVETAGSQDSTSTMFDVPPNIDTGASTLVVVANGIISSNSFQVTITASGKAR